MDDDPSDSPLEPLTEMQMKVVELLARGESTEEIAKILVISPDAVRIMIQTIVTKLRVHSRQEPPPSLPPAASMALEVPRVRPEDVPKHVGRKMLGRGPRPA